MYNVKSIDHKGIEYASKSEMCKHYGIRRSTFERRIEKGMSLKDALTTPINKVGCRAKKCVDHLGSEYLSEAKMCEHYNINFYTYRERIQKGYSIERALTEPLMEQGLLFKNECFDHLGKKYNSEKEMAMAYGIEPYIFAMRKYNGWDVRRALTTPVRGTKIYDHLGNEYDNVEKMCSVYNIEPKLYHDRLHKGWSLEKSLTTQKRNTLCEDHLGNKYRSMDEMAHKYGLCATTIKNRLKKGLTLKEALTMEYSYVCYDHLGNKYDSLQKMCEAYGISFGVYKYRLKKGMSIKEALTYQRKSPVSKKVIKASCSDYHSTDCYDHLGNWYASKADMARAYGINPNTFRARLYSGMSIEKALTLKAPKKISNEEMKLSLVGTSQRMNCGLFATIIEYINNQNLIIEFEDGIKMKTSLREYKNGNVMHPYIKKGNFYGWKCKYNYISAGDSVYFCATELKTGKRDILTLHQIIEMYQQTHHLKGTECSSVCSGNKH